MGTLNTGYNGTGCDLTATRALGLAPSAGDVPLRSAPYEYRQLNSVVSADYRITRPTAWKPASSARISAAVPRAREDVGKQDSTRLRQPRFQAGSLRVSYEYGSRRGSDFVAAPLADFYSSSLGPVPTAPTTNMTTWLRNVDQFRRFDVADRDQNVFSAMFNYGLGPALDASVGLQVKDLKYPTSQVRT